MSKEKLCVITLIPTKKLDKFGLQNLETSLNGIPCIELQPSKVNILKTVKDLSKSFEKLLILHKLGDYSEDELSSATIEALKSMADIIWLDDPSNSNKLSNRWTMYQLIKTYLSTTNLKYLRVTVPDTSLLETNQRMIFQENSVLKPVDACGTHSSHQMIFLPAYTEFTSTDIKYIRQPFIEHGAVMWKLYVIGEHVSIVPRRSLESQTEIVIFSSHDLREESIETDTLIKASDRMNDIRDQLKQLALSISLHCCGLRLLGIDVIMDVNGIINVIDLNYFPGYDGVDDIPDKLAACISQQVD